MGEALRFTGKLFLQNKKKKEEELHAIKKKEDITQNTALSSLFDQLKTK